MVRLLSHDVDFGIVLYGCYVLVLCFFFFFSSRRRHTRSDRDWSSDVCSSDLTCADVHKYITPVVTCNLSKVVSTAIDIPSSDKAVNLFYKTPFLGTHLFDGDRKSVV